MVRRGITTWFVHSFIYVVDPFFQNEGIYFSVFFSRFFTLHGTGKEKRHFVACGRENEKRKLFGGRDEDKKLSIYVLKLLLNLSIN